MPASPEVGDYFVMTADVLLEVSTLCFLYSINHRCVFCEYHDVNQFVPTRLHTIGGGWDDVKVNQETTDIGCCYLRVEQGRK